MRPASLPGPGLTVDRSSRPWPGGDGLRGGPGAARGGGHPEQACARLRAARMGELLHPMLTAREIAKILWHSVFAARALACADVRSSVLSVLRIALLPKLAGVWLALAAYTAGMIWSLGRLGWWDRTMTKVTLVWFLFTAVAYPVRFMDSSEAPRVLPSILRDAFSVTIVVEFLVDSRPFSLPIELLFVPLVIAVSLLAVFAQLHPGHRAVARLLDAVLFGMGFALLIRSIRLVIGDPNFSVYAAVREMMLPSVLSVGSVPFILGLRLRVNYDDLLWRIGYKADVKWWFRHYGAARILWHARFRSAGVKKILHRHGPDLLRVGNKAELSSLLNAGDLSSLR